MQNDEAKLADGRGEGRETRHAGKGGRDGQGTRGPRRGTIVASAVVERWDESLLSDSINVQLPCVLQLLYRICCPTMPPASVLFVLFALSSGTCLDSQPRVLLDY